MSNLPDPIEINLQPIRNLSDPRIAFLCETASGLLSLAGDGVEFESVHLDAHLLTCDICQQRLAGMKRQN
jgi:hypothetical protein